jgi:hypothetical protein
MAEGKGLLTKQHFIEVLKAGQAYKPRQNIVYVSAERSRPCWTNVTYQIYTPWLSGLESLLRGTGRPCVRVKVMFPKQGRLHSPPE